MNVPSKVAEELILQLESWKQQLKQLGFDLEKYGSSSLAKSPARNYWLILIVLQNLPNRFQLLRLAHMRMAG